MTSLLTVAGQHDVWPGLLLPKNGGPPVSPSNTALVTEIQQENKDVGVICNDQDGNILYT